MSGTNDESRWWAILVGALVVCGVLGWMSFCADRARAQSDPSWLCMTTLPTWGPYPLEVEIDGVRIPAEPYRWQVLEDGRLEQCVHAPADRPRPWRVTGRVVSGSGAKLEAVLADGRPGPLYVWGPASCRADLNSSGVVDLGDIPPLLGSWGCGGLSCRADLSGNEVVDLPDVAAFLRLFGDAAGCGGT